MSDPTFNSVTVRQPTAGASADLLTLDSVDGADGNGAALRFVNNSVGPLNLALGRISVSRVDPSTVRLDLAVAADPSLSSGDTTPALLSLLKGAGPPSITTAAGSTLAAGGTLSVSGAASFSSGLSITGALAVAGDTALSGGLSVSGITTLSGGLSVSGAASFNTGLSVSGDMSVSGSIDGRDVSTDGARLDTHLANLANPHGTTAAQVGALALAGGALTGELRVQGALLAGGSDLYFTETTHNHTGVGNTPGFAAIENATDYDALMILGRAGTPRGRAVKLWDYLQVNGSMDITGNLGVGTVNPTHKFHVFTGEAVGLFESNGAQAFLRFSTREGLGNRVEITNRPGGRFSVWTAGGGDAFNVTRAGFVGIGTVTPQYRLQVAGRMHAADNIGIGNYRPDQIPAWSGGGLICWDVLYGGGLHKLSTIRVKENIQPLSDALALIGQLNPVRYDRRAAEGATRDYLGFIAEEVREVAPQCASSDDDFFAWGVNESNFHALAIAGIQELTRRLALLERRQRPLDAAPQRHAAQAPVSILRERRDPQAPAEIYATVRFRADHATFGQIETVRTLRLPPDLPREQLFHLERERWLATLETPAS